MENRDDKNQSTSQQTDLSKAQNQQQPQGQQGQSQQPEGQSQQQQPFGQQNQSQQTEGQQQPQGQADYGSAGQYAGQSDTASQQRSDIEGGTSTGQASNEGSSQFVGSKDASDTSGELVEDDESGDIAKHGQGAAE